MMIGLLKKYAKWRNRKSWQVFLAIGVVCTLLLLGMLWAVSRGSGSASYSQPPSPNFSSFVPAGGKLEDVSVVINDTPFTSYVIAFSVSGRSAVGLLVFDKWRGKYMMTSTVLLSGANGSFREVSAIEKGMARNGAIILVRGNAGEQYGRGVLVLHAQGKTLRSVEKINKDQTLSPAYFTESETKQRAKSVGLENIAIDDVAELVDSSRIFSSSTGQLSDVVTDVYRWDGERFVYDAKLSTMLMLDGTVFPVAPEVK